MNWIKKLVCLIFIISPMLSLYAQETLVRTTVPTDDNVSFTEPEGYVDPKFRELSQEYLQPKMPNDIQNLLGKDGTMTPELIQRIIDLIYNKVSSKVKNDLVDNFKLAQIKKIIDAENNKKKKGAKNTTAKKSVTKKTSLIVADTNKRKHIYINTNASSKQKNPAPVKVKKKTLPTVNPASFSQKISISGIVGNKININSASQKSIRIYFQHPNNLNNIKVKLMAKNIKTGKTFPIKTKIVNVKKGSSKTQLTVVWNNPNIPMGQYNIILQTSFIKHNKSVKNQSSIWIDTNNKPYIAVKN